MRRSVSFESCDIPFLPGYWLAPVEVLACPRDSRRFCSPIAFPAAPGVPREFLESRGISTLFAVEFRVAIQIVVFGREGRKSRKFRTSFGRPAEHRGGFWGDTNLRARVAPNFISVEPIRPGRAESHPGRCGVVSKMTA